MTGSEYKTQREKTYKPKDLVYAALSRCPCGAGLAYPKNSGAHGEWDCSAILTGTAPFSGQPGAVTHTDKKPFAFWKIETENSVRYPGETTRPEHQ